MSQSTTPTLTRPPWQEPTTAYPPRFRWLKRGAVLFVVTLLAMSALRWWWGKVADNRLAAMVAEAHTRGEPILPEDFNQKPIPDGENAAVTLRLAADSVVRDAAYDSFDNTWLGGPLTPADIRQIEHILSINQKPLKLCRDARSQSGADWKIKVKRPTMGMPLQHLGAQRQLVLLMEWAALRDHALGNDVEAVERVRDILHQAMVLDHSLPCVINHLVALGLSAVAISILEQITPDLRFEPVGLRHAEVSFATREQIRSLIDELLSENDLTKSAIRSWQGEAMGVLDTALYSGATGTLPFGNTPFPFNSSEALKWLSPTIALDGMQLSRNSARFGVANAKPEWPMALQCLSPELQGDESTLAEVAEVFSRTFDTSSSAPTRAVLEHFKVLTDRRATAIALSLRMYRLDHSGRLPPTLQQLVPQYLPYVPLDPMAVGGRPMQYRPSRKPPVIYSVGIDGVDNGGTSMATETGFQRLRWNNADVVYPLEPLPPESQPSLETQNHK